MLTYKNILKDDNPLVRKTSLPVKLPLSKKDKKTLEDMITYVRNSVDEDLSVKHDLKPAVGLAAPQLGILKQMFAMSVAFEKEDESLEYHEYAFVNPKIISYSVKQAYLKEGEGCLSVVGEHDGFVPRSARIVIRGYDLLQENVVEVKLSGYLAIIAQHEMDHFNGVLFYDRINKTNPFQQIDNAIVIE